PPEGTQPLLLRGGRAVAAPGLRPSRVAARDGRAVERLVEGVLVEVEPATQRPTGATPPRTALEAFLHSGCLPIEVCALAVNRRQDRQRLERVPGFDAGAAHTKVALERGQRAVGRPPPCHGERTATNQRRSKIVTPSCTALE